MKEINEIICPNCKKVFKVDEAGYADILKQAEKEKLEAVKLAEANLKNSLQEDLAKKDIEITRLKAKNELELSEMLAKKDSDISELKSKINSVRRDGFIKWKNQYQRSGK